MRFKVELTRQFITYQALAIEVEAESEDAAREKAASSAYRDQEHPEAVWEDSDCSTAELEVESVTPITEEE